MQNKKEPFEKLQKQIQNFCEERDWDQFHGAKDLAIGAVTEASELLELFRFQSEKDIESFFDSPEFRQKISDELADVLFFVLRLSQKYNIDLSEAFENKMKKNESRYPAAEFKGKNHKSVR